MDKIIFNIYLLVLAIGFIVYGILVLKGNIRFGGPTPRILIFTIGFTKPYISLIYSCIKSWNLLYFISTTLLLAVFGGALIYVGMGRYTLFNINVDEAFSMIEDILKVMNLEYIKGNAGFTIKNYGKLEVNKDGSSTNINMGEIEGKSKKNELINAIRKRVEKYPRKLNQSCKTGIAYIVVGFFMIIFSVFLKVKNM